MTDAEDLRVSEELQKQFQSLKLEVEADAESFKNVTGSLEDSLKDATDGNKRSEWLKVEAGFNMLKEKLVKLVSMDESQDAVDSQEVKGKFQEAETAFTKFHNWILPQLKDDQSLAGVVLLPARRLLVHLCRLHLQRKKLSVFRALKDQ